MNKKDTLEHFRNILKNDPEKSEGVAAIETLFQYIQQDDAETLHGFMENIQKASTWLEESDLSGAVTSISSGCQLFLRFITLAKDPENMESDIQKCKEVLLKRGHVFLDKVKTLRAKISKLANSFITDGSTILVHSHSRVVLQVLKQAMQDKKRFTVYVTESNPDKSGHKMVKDLTDVGIPAILVLDSAVGYIMEKIDFAMVGAEGVMESGGIINKIGTFTMAVCAKYLNKPVYVLAESFKFARLFPLSQEDVPNKFKYKASKLYSKVDLTKEHPNVDYTPPALITLLFTDLGILTPSAVSDELLKLYL